MRIKTFVLLISLSTFYGCAKEYSCEDCIPPSPPEVKTVQITDITINNARIYGELTKTGKLLITDYGFCWASHPIPTLSDNKISFGQTDSLQSFDNLQNGLSPNTIYYVRAFAINSMDTVYGVELSFKTLENTLLNCLVAYYPFNGNTNDASGNNNNGIATGGSFSTDKNGSTNKAYSFNGSDYIRVPNSISLSGIGNGFSMSAWVYNEQPESYIVCKATYNGPDMQFRIYTDRGGIHFANYHKAADFNVTINPVNSWKHIAITCDGVSAKCYINGNLVNTTTLHTDPAVANNGTDMYIGADTHNVTELFTGKLDEIRIYCRELSAGEVQQIYNL